MKTSDVIRASINEAWEHHAFLVRADCPMFARQARRSIRAMERDYRRALARELREQP